MDGVDPVVEGIGHEEQPEREEELGQTNGAKGDHPSRYDGERHK